MGIPSIQETSLMMRHYLGFPGNGAYEVEHIQVGNKIDSDWKDLLYPAILLVTVLRFEHVWCFKRGDVYGIGIAYGDYDEGPPSRYCNFWITEDRLPEEIPDWIKDALKVVDEKVFVPQNGAHSILPM